MRPPYPAPHAIMSEVVEWVARGWSLERVAQRAGMPSRQTLYRWAKAVPTFAQQMADARSRVRFEMRAARDAGDFHAEIAQALLHRVRCGDRVSDLVRRPEWPHRERLDRWKRIRPEFAAALAEAVRYARRYRRLTYDEAEADAWLVRVVRGEAVTDAGAPSKPILRRWRAADPEFAGGYAAAKRSGHRRRMAARRKLTPELTAKIVERIRMGDSLASLSRRRGMPHRVTLYGWLKSRPGFAAAVAKACDEREWILNEQKLMRLNGLSEAEARATMRKVGGVARRARPRRPGG